MHAELPRDLETLVRLVRLNGWEVDYSSGGRLRVHDRHGQFAGSVSNHAHERDVMNFRAKLKRAGLRPDPLPRQKPPVQQTSIEYFSPPSPQEPQMSAVPNITPEPEKKRRYTVKRGTLRRRVMQLFHNDSVVLDLDQVYELVKDDFPNVPRGVIAQATTSYSLRWREGAAHLERVGRGHYRLARSSSVAPEVSKEQPDDDAALEVALTKLLEASSEIERIVRKQKAWTRKRERLLAILGDEDDGE